MLELKNVSKYYTVNGVTNLGLRNINLKFNRGEIVGIVGESGSGKSTLLNVISKLDIFDDGEIYYKGNETSYFNINDMDDFRKNRIGFIFQNYNIIESYTVLENVMMPLIIKGVNNKEAKEKALELIEKVGLKERCHVAGIKLSGGEKQRCVIARALASDCSILACDEPTGNLDSKTALEIINLIKEVASDKLVLIVTHNYEDFSDICTRKIRISDGEVIEDFIYEEKEEDKDEMLDLDYKPLERKVAFNIATKNILFTPKKSIFLGVVFFVVFLITFILLEGIYMINTTMPSVNDYSNHQNDRVYVYSSNLDLSKIENLGNIEYITTYEDYYVNIESDDLDIYSNCYFTSYCSNYDLIKGNMPLNNEFLIITSDKTYLSQYKDAVGKTVNIYSNLLNSKLVLSGCAYSKNVKDDVIILSKDLEKKVKENSITKKLILNNYNNYKLIYNDSIDKLKVKCSDENYNLSINNKEITNVDYEYSTENIIEYNDYAFANSVGEVSIYNSNVDYVKNSCNELGYDCDIVAKLVDSDKVEQNMIMNMTVYILLLSISPLIFIFAFITYFILSKIYSSKRVDYQILRTLGVTKKDMTKVVKYEVLIVGVISMILSYLVGLILFNTSFMASIVTFSVSLIYFLLALLYTLLIARKFNKKLFKFSVTKSLKEEL